MTPGFYCVVTTINPPGCSMKALGEAIARTSGTFLVIGDKKGPVDFHLPGARLLPLSVQVEMPLKLAPLLPVGHYARKNLGYLVAMNEGAPTIFETDDDNGPTAGWAMRRLRIEAETVSFRGWFNVYSLFSDELLWPRGFPLAEIRRLDPALSAGKTESIEAPIQQGLVDESPDVDAVWRLVLDRPVRFRPRPPVHLAPGTWCPFNSQWTWWWPAAYPLLYLPSYCSFRMTDIWRSFVAQRCLWELGVGVVFHSPEAVQERNPHNLLRDFEDEVPGYLHNPRLCELLTNLALSPGADRVGANLLRCYETLVANQLFPPEELSLVSAWLEDVEAVVSGT